MVENKRVVMGIESFSEVTLAAEVVLHFEQSEKLFVFGLNYKAQALSLQTISVLEP